MSIQNKEKPFAKEVDDVMELLVVLVSDIKAKKDIGEISADVLPKLLNAINGIDQVPEEFKADMGVGIATVGYSTGTLAGALLK